MKHLFSANDRVSLAIDDLGIAHLRLTRQAKLNALDPEMIEALLDAGQTLFDMPGLRCVVIAGEGKAFCTGLDLSTFQAALDADGIPLTQRTHGNANRFQQVAMQWRKLPVPVIASIHGACLGGGLQLAGGADVRIAAPDTRLAILEMRWGIVPDMGGFALWRGSVRDDVLRELTYTNREFSGEEAISLGFVTLVDADPVARATAIAQDIASKSPSAIRAAKTLFNRYLDLGTDEILQEESFAQQRLLGTKNQIEAVRSQMEGRPGTFGDP
ncbi:MAG TPA: crotonase/enoyl-CoA hydratase family protein [Novosphingobium sp.]